MPNKAYTTLLCTLLTLTFTGCASLKNQDITSDPKTIATEKATIESLSENKNEPKKPQKKPIAPETLYDLLIAEMGGKVNRLEIALGNYMRQAHLTKDPKVIERYAKIASYMQAAQATEDATQLWLSIEPENIDALHLQLIMQMGQADSQKQEQALREILAQTDELNLLIIEQALNSGSEEQRALFHNVIAALFDDTSQQFRENEHLWYLKAKSNSLNGHHSDVILDVKKLHRLNKNFLPSYVLLVDAYEKTNQLEKAQKSLENLIRLDPTNKKIRLYYARLLVRLEKFSKAEQEFSTLIELYPEDLDLLLTAGVLASQSGSTAKARAYFERLLAVPYRTNEALFQLGLLEEQAGNIDEAITALLRITPSAVYQEARFRAAQMQSAQGDLNAGLQTFSDAAILQPNAKHLYIIGSVELLAEAQQFDQALSLITEALEESPEELNLLYSRAILYSQMDRHSQSEKDLRKVLSKAPNNVAALNALGYTLADRNIRLDEAQVLLDKAIKLSPNDPPILDSLGWLAFRKGDLNAAKSLLEEAYSLLQDPEIAAHLGEVLWLLGNQKRAIQIWNEGLELKPNSPIILETMKRLQAP